MRILFRYSVLLNRHIREGGFSKADIRNTKEMKKIPLKQKPISSLISFQSLEKDLQKQKNYSLDMRQEKIVELTKEGSESNLKSKNYRRLSSKNDSVFYLKLNKMLKRQLNEKINLQIIPKPRSPSPYRPSIPKKVNIENMKIKTGGFIPENKGKKNLNMTKKIQLVKATGKEPQKLLPRLQPTQNKGNHKRVRSVTSTAKVETRHIRSLSRPNERIRLFRAQDIEMIRRNNYYIDNQDNTRVSKMVTSEENGEEVKEMNRLTQISKIKAGVC